MTEDQHIFNGYVGSVGASVSTAKDFSYIRFESGEGFKHSMTHELKIKGGKTIGQANRDWLHSKLDEWIEENLKDKNEQDSPSAKILMDTEQKETPPERG